MDPKVKVVGHMNMKILRANMEIDGIRKKERLARLARKKSGTFASLQTVPATR